MNKLKSIVERLLPPILTTVLKRILRASPYRPERVALETPEHPQGAAILKEAWAHLDTTASLSRVVQGIPASERWTALLDRMRDDIRSFTTAQEAIRFGQSRLDFDHREPVEACAHLFQLHAETLRHEFPHFAHWLDALGDSAFSRPETMVQARGQLVSNVFFFHVRYVMQCLTWVPQPELVCEIGGGYGAPARLWLLNPAHRPKTYLIVDFPESLFFAEVFLKSNFDGLKVHYVADAKPLEPGFVKEHTVVLCPIHHVAALGGLTLDLVVNTGSMQEMTADWIDFWMAWLQRQDCRHFYSLNYFAQPLNYLAESGNTWAPRLTPEWTTRLAKSNPALVMQQTTRNYAEILAEKTGTAPTRAELQARYAAVRERVLDGQALLECMDIVRHGAGEDVLWDLLQRAAELRTVPKEAYYLAESLTKNSSEAFRREHGAKLTELFARLQRVRAAGQENVYSA